MIRVVLVVLALLVVGGALNLSDAVAQEVLSISGIVWEDLDADGVRDRRRLRCAPAGGAHCLRGWHMGLRRA